MRFVWADPGSGNCSHCLFCFSEYQLGIDELLREKREDILRIATRHGMTSIRVFGSVARGEAARESDIDADR